MVTEFVVEGLYEFPLDMLRYDGCHPAAQEDVGAISRSLSAESRKAQRDTGKPFRVRLIRIVPRNYAAMPTGERWRSFGWSVDPHSIRGESR